MATYLARSVRIKLSGLPVIARWAAGTLSGRPAQWYGEPTVLDLTAVQAT
jgi:hypothetical protein